MMNGNLIVEQYWLRCSRAKDDFGNIITRDVLELGKSGMVNMLARCIEAQFSCKRCDVGTWTNLFEFVL